MVFYYDSSCSEASERYRSGEEYEDEEEEEQDEDAMDRYYWPFRNIGAPHDVLQPKGELLKQMSHLLAEEKGPDELQSFGDAADVLPGLPGLSVKDVGYVSLPMREESADQLKAVANEVRGNLWMFRPDQVEMKNPEWGRGIQTLSKLCTEKLGLTDVTLVPVLTTVLLYGKGGRLARHQVSDSTGRSVATIVVQLPSVYTGGDLVVNDNSGEQGLQYDFGKEEGAAEFKPHFAVYPIGAYVSVEEVTSGYVMVAAYSLCLPLELPDFSGRSAFLLQLVQLSEVIKKIVATEESMKGAMTLAGVNLTKDGDSGILALMLSQSCNEKEIKTNGVESLSDLDGYRTQILIAANRMLPPSKQLKFYLACLCFRSAYPWCGVEAQERISWFEVDGNKIADTTDISLKWSKKFKFLNPGNETFAQLWKNESGYCSQEHKRFALVGWPIWSNIKNTFTWIGEVAAANAVLASQPDLHNLQAFLRCEREQYTETRPLHISYGSEYTYAARYGILSSNQRKSEASAGQLLSLQLCQTLCTAIAESKDAKLVATFFEACFSRLKEKRELVPNMATLVRAFGWESVKTSIEKAFDRLSYADSTEFVLMIAELVKANPLTRGHLTTFALKKAKLWSIANPSEFVSSKDVAVLWRCAAACGSPHQLHDLRQIFQHMEGSLLQPVVKVLSKLVSGASPQEQRFVLVSIVARRRDWLASEIASIQKPFTFRVLDYNFPNATELVAFFNGPNTSCVIRGFKSIGEARSRVALLNAKVRACLTMTSEGRGALAFVRITKTSGVFHPRRAKLPEYTTEYYQLNQLMAFLVPVNNPPLAQRLDATNASVMPAHLTSVPSAKLSGKLNQKKDGGDVSGNIGLDADQNADTEGSLPTDQCDPSSRACGRAIESYRACRMPNNSSPNKLASPDACHDNASPINITRPKDKQLLASDQNSPNEVPAAVNTEAAKGSELVHTHDDHSGEIAPPYSIDDPEREEPPHETTADTGSVHDGTSPTTTIGGFRSDIVPAKQNDCGLNSGGVRSAIDSEHSRRQPSHVKRIALAIGHVQGGHGDSEEVTIKVLPSVGGPEERGSPCGSDLIPAVVQKVGLLPICHSEAVENTHCNASWRDVTTSIGKKRPHEDDPESESS